MKNFKDHLKENSFYSNDTEKGEFLSDDKKIISAFFYGFLGWVSLLGSAKKKERVKAYFKKDAKLRVTSITDDNNDVSLIIKIMADKGYFISPNTPNEITRFLVKAKSGQIDSVDPDIVKGWINQIKPGEMQKAPPALKKINKRFQEGGTLGQMAYDLRQMAKRTDWKTSEVNTLTKGIMIDKNVGKVQFDSVGDASTPPAPVDSTTTTTTTTTATKSPKKKAPVKKVPFDLNDVSHYYDELYHGRITPTEILDKYKLNATVRKEFLEALVNDIHLRGLELGDTFKNSKIVEKIVGLHQNFNPHNPTYVELFLGKGVGQKTSRWSRRRTGIHAASLEYFGVTNLYAYNKWGLPDIKVAKVQNRLNDYFNYNYPTIMSDIVFQSSLHYENMLNPTYFKSYLESVRGDSPAKKRLESIEKNVFFKLYKKDNIGTLNNSHVKMYEILTDTNSTPEDLAKISKEIFPESKTVFKGPDGNIYYWSDDKTDYGISYTNKKVASRIILAGYAKYLGVKPSPKDHLILAAISNDINGSVFRTTWRWGDGDKMGSISDLEKFKKFFDQYIESLPPEKFSAPFFMETMLPNKNIHENNKVLLPIIAKHIVKYLDSLPKKELFNFVDRTYAARNKLKLSEFPKSYKQSLVKSFEKGILNAAKDITIDDYHHQSTLRILKFADTISDNKIFKDLYLRVFKEYLDKDEINSYNTSYGSPFRGILDYKGLSLSDGKEDEIETLLIQKAIKGYKKERSFYSTAEKTTNDVPTSLRPYSELSIKNKKLYLKAMEEDGDDYPYNLRSSVDVEFLDEFPPERLSDLLGGDEVYLDYVSRKDEKNYVKKFDELADSKDDPVRFIEDWKYKEGLRLNDSPSRGWHITSEGHKILLGSKHIPEKYFKDVIDELVSDRSKSWVSYSGPSFIFRLIDEDEDSLSERQMYAFEKILKIADDPKLNPKLRKEYSEFMTNAQPRFNSLIQSDLKRASDLYEGLSLSMRRRLASSYLKYKEFRINASTDLTNEKNPIKPFEKLDEKRIKEILKYNNVTSDESTLAAKHVKSIQTLDDWANDPKHQTPPLEDLRVTEVEMDRNDLGALSARIHREKRNGRHGDVSMAIKRVFNVSIPLQEEAQKEWIDNQPDQEIINPMFHGTGSIAASMILRYGFRVIKSGDPSVVGRMLGNGVYGAIHIDKSQQYVGDGGFSRGFGTKGYIFEMNAALGVYGKDYKVMGLGNDHIRSPEWCVFTPNSQFKIVKAYEVELISPSTIRKILAEHPETVEEGKTRRFKSFMKEEANPIPRNVLTYTFVNGNIPTKTDEYEDFEKAKFENPEVRIEPSSYGPTVVIPSQERSGNYIFTSPTEFQNVDPDLYKEYMNLIEKS